MSNPLPDLVYPVRLGGLNDPEWMRYSLRTFWHHIPHNRVFVIGHLPNYLTNVLHIRSDQRTQRYANKPEPLLSFRNQQANLQALMSDDRVGENVLWVNDDFFALKDHDSIPFYYRGKLSTYTPIQGTHEYGVGLARCLKVLNKWGYPDPNNYAVHAPLPVHLPRLREVMARAWEDGIEGGFMRAIYPVGDTTHPHAYISDPKIKPATLLPPDDWTWVSTTPASWSGKVGDFIRARYWRPSPYEGRK